MTIKRKKVVLTIKSFHFLCYLKKIGNPFIVGNLVVKSHNFTLSYVGSIFDFANSTYNVDGELGAHMSCLGINLSRIGYH
jgi:hypothetical protein